MPTKAKQDKILSSLALATHMVTETDSPYYRETKHLYDNSLFLSYSSHRYRNRQKDRKEMDEIYRFGTTVFLHLLSGLRCEYSIHEFYYGGEEYKLNKLFVITNDNEPMDVSDVDFEKNIVVTTKGNISFDLLKKYVGELD